jgi:hypothetical protein
MERQLILQELGIVLAVPNRAATLLTPEFLQQQGIVPSEWQLVDKPMHTPTTTDPLGRNVTDTYDRTSHLTQETNCKDTITYLFGKVTLNVIASVESPSESIGSGKIGRQYPNTRKLPGPRFLKVPNLPKSKIISFDLVGRIWP